MPGPVRLLDGIRVLEVASMIVAPAAGVILSDFGAEVIKVEPPAGDENRRLHELPTLPQSSIPYTASSSITATSDTLFAGQDLEHWRRAFEAHDIPFSAVASYDEVIRDEQVGAIGVFPEMDGPRWGRLRTVDSPLSVAGAPKVTPRAAPELGQHTSEVLHELGYTDAEIRDLLERRVAVQAGP